MYRKSYMTSNCAPTKMFSVTAALYCYTYHVHSIRYLSIIINYINVDWQNTMILLYTNNNKKYMRDLSVLPLRENNFITAKPQTSLDFNDVAQLIEFLTPFRDYIRYIITTIIIVTRTSLFITALATLHPRRVVDNNYSDGSPPAICR